MIDAPSWFVFLFDFLLIVILFVGIFFLRAWWNVKRHQDKMYAEIWEPSGFAVKHLVEPDPTGATITVNNLVYRLPKELGEKELEKAKSNPRSHTYPRRRWINMPNSPLPPIPVRVESWERDNPEAIRPFYGHVTEDGKFEDSQLTVTSTEWQAQKSVIQATGIAMSVQEREAREKEWTRAMANLPNKLIVYLGIGIAAICSAVGLAIIYQMAGM